MDISYGHIIYVYLYVIRNEKKKIGYHHHKDNVYT